ncbi:SIS domain-containing protein [Candidatus Daviesbacteria bacterium]|nr:SIS domain-containing protein [Candidatus Daviesbacteria bacterium]
MTKKPKAEKIDYIDSFLKGVIDICRNIAQKDIDQVVEYLFKAWWNQNNIFLIGNGGSASAALHFVADLNNCTAKISGVHPVHALSLVDNMIRFSALVNDVGWDNVYVDQIKNYFKPGDVVFAISVHGGTGRDQAQAWSQNLVKALKYAQDNGGRALAMTGFDGGLMKQICDACIVIPYNTTPHVEGFYGVVHHLITERLTDKIKQAAAILAK